MPIPIVDLFAGPCGLSEGFENYQKKGARVFHSVLAIEKDEYAHQTLLLRSFLRQFSRPPEAYYAPVAQKFTTRAETGEGRYTQDDQAMGAYRWTSVPSVFTCGASTDEGEDVKNIQE